MTYLNANKMSIEKWSHLPIKLGDDLNRIMFVSKNNMTDCFSRFNCAPDMHPSFQQSSLSPYKSTLAFLSGTCWRQCEQ